MRRVTVDAKASWNKINASSQDGTLLVATSVDATAKAMQRKALCSVISQTFRGAGTSVARIRWTAHYARASAQGSSFVQRRIPIAGAKGQRTRVRWTARYASAIAGGACVFAVCGGGLRMRTTDSERGPSWYHFGAIQ